MISSSSISTIGEKLSFFQLFNEKQWRIEVPIIQRDYAQGRESAKEIRHTFLRSLKEHLDSGENIDLDFVYGSLSEVDNSIFIPLDGQQRLTTLFLLHWYLARLEGKGEILDSFLLDGAKSKFSYKTRTSSSEFCDALLVRGVDLTTLLPSDKDLANSLSKTIKDSEWYFSTWGNDPTIQSMLAMLDAIHGMYDKPKGYFDKLIDSGIPIITFQFLNLKEFRLTDDLYIKMNARGKQLTPFENFKANFEQHIGDLNIPGQQNQKLVSETGEKNVPVKEYFSHKIDTDWANLFWKFKNEKEKTYDAQLMNFIRVVITNHFALKSSFGDLDLIYVRYLIGKEDANEKDKEAPPITYAAYKALGCLDKELILGLCSILDVIEDSEHFKVYLPNNIYFNEKGIFDDVIRNRLNYTERLQFYAFYQFLIVNGSSVGLEDWIRIIHNLSENSIYNNAEQFARSLKSIQSLLPHSTTILDYMADPLNSVTGFVEIQVTEERIKAQLFKKSEAWRTAILDVESHGYFKGQIGFILNFSGIEGWYLTSKKCNWSDTDDAEFLKSFIEYSDKAKAIFGQHGLRKIPDFLLEDNDTVDRGLIWEQALLTKGNYLLSANSNNSFLIDKDRDISWKSLLRDDNWDDKGHRRRLYVKDLFDDPNFDATNVRSSLIKIVELSDIQDWRKHFIESADVLRYLGAKRYIRWVNEDLIYLLEKVRMSGPHAEYYSYAFYCKYLTKGPISPFSASKYYPVSGDDDDDPPCAYMDGWRYENSEYTMAVLGHNSTQVELVFHNRNRSSISEQIRLILESHSFVQNQYWYGLAKDFNSAYSVIEAICNDFQKLSV